MSTHTYNKENPLITPVATIYMDEDGLARCTFNPQVTDLDKAKEHQRLVNEHMADVLPHYTLVDIRNVKQTSKECRRYFGSKAVEETTDATALLMGSGLSKIVGNLFLKFSNPLIPTRLFTKEEEARAWLLAQRAKKK